MNARAVAFARSLARRATDKLGWLGPLLVRITLGVTFMSTGWGKLQDLPKVTAFFTELGIPAPHFNAILAASAELVCGTALLLGLLTRLATIPLIVTMIVAIVTAKRAQLDGVIDLLGLEEWTYIAAFVWLALVGPGAASLDRLLGRALERRPAPPAATALPVPSTGQ
jgi:putative oxidoreductase